MATAWALPVSELPIADTLLLQIAAKIQLSRTDYGIAIGHYEAIDKWLSRKASPIAHVYGGLYPQGSMAIGATIASRLNNDEFDIDVIANLEIDRNAPASAVLDALFDAVNGEKGSLYHGKVERNSRCVTVSYDRMHLDITPAVLLPELAERTSVIFHANESEPPVNHRHIVANPWGFAEWFKQETPEVREIVESVFAKAAEPVPEQDDVLEKSVSLIALQLLKRWRNKRYDNRTGRSPPSVVLAYFVAQGSGRATSLFSELRFQADALLVEFASSDAERRLVAVHNPACVTDVLTDRWPSTLADQSVFLDDIRHLVRALDQIESDPSVEICARVFANLFGENVTQVVMEEFRKGYEIKSASGGLFTSVGGRGIALAASGLSNAPSAVRAQPIPRHTDFGD